MYRLAVILAAEARADGSAGTRTPAPGRSGLIGPGPRGGRAPCDWCAGFGARSGARQPDPAHVSTVGHAKRAVRESQPSASRPQDAGLKIGGDLICGGPVDLRANSRTARKTFLLVLWCRAKPAGRSADPADVSHLP